MLVWNAPGSSQSEGATVDSIVEDKHSDVQGRAHEMNALGNIASTPVLFTPIPSQIRLDITRCPAR
jgi:hypothetical protein